MKLREVKGESLLCLQPSRVKGFERLLEAQRLCELWLQQPYGADQNLQSLGNSGGADSRWRPEVEIRSDQVEL